MIKWHNRDGACGRPFSVQKGGFMADYLIEVAGGALWQWDTGRKIKIQTWENRSVTEAHFSIVGSDQALVLDVYEENGEMFSNIPNILLQQEEKIRIYLVDNNRTVGDHTEPIIPRTKPDDYVYTETEIKNFETLEKKIPTKMSQLEQDIDTTFDGVLDLSDGFDITDFGELGDSSKNGVYKVAKAGNFTAGTNTISLAVGSMIVYRTEGDFRNATIYLALTEFETVAKIVTVNTMANDMRVSLNECIVPSQEQLGEYQLKNCMIDRDTFFSNSFNKGNGNYPSMFTMKNYVDAAVASVFEKEVEIVPNGTYVQYSSYSGNNVSGDFKIPTVGQECKIILDGVEMTKIATEGTNGVRIGDTTSEIIIEIINETTMYIESTRSGPRNIHVTCTETVEFATTDDLESSKKEKCQLLKTIEGISFVECEYGGSDVKIKYADFNSKVNIDTATLEGNSDTDTFEIVYHFNVSGYISKIVLRREDFSLWKDTSGVYHFNALRLPASFRVTYSGVDLPEPIYLGFCWGRSFDNRLNYSGYVWTNSNLNVSKVEIYKITR